MIVPDTAKGLAFYDHPFFGKYPAITQNQFGKGTLTYEGTFLSDKLQRAVLLAVLKEAGLTSADQDLPASVRVKHGQNRNGKTLHFYLNYSSSPQTLNYSYGAGTELLSHTNLSHGQALAVESMGRGDRGGKLGDTSCFGGRQGRALGQGKPAQSSWRCPFFAQLFQLNRRKPAAAATEERVAQFYLGDSHASIPRPEKELKGFAKVNSPAGRVKATECDARPAGIFHSTM